MFPTPYSEGAYGGTELIKLYTDIGELEPEQNKHGGYGMIV
jgi:hypothetical protein